MGGGRQSRYQFTEFYQGIYNDMHANTSAKLNRMYSAKSYHKESIQNSGNGIKRREEKNRQECLYQSRGIAEQHLHFHVSLCI